MQKITPFLWFDDQAEEAVAAAKQNQLLSVHLNIVLAAKTCLYIKLVQSMHHTCGKLTHELAGMTVVIFLTTWNCEGHAKLIGPHDDRSSACGTPIDRNSIFETVTHIHFIVHILESPHECTIGAISIKT